MTKKDWEKQFIENLEKYVSTGDEDAKEDFMYAANVLVRNWYKPMSVRDLYKKVRN